MLNKKVLSNNSLNSKDSRSYSIDSRSYSIDSISCEIRPQSSESRTSSRSSYTIGLTISPCNSYEDSSYLKKQMENEKHHKKKQEEDISKIESDLFLINIENKNKNKNRRKKDFNFTPLEKEPKTVEQLKKSLKKFY